MIMFPLLNYIIILIYLSLSRAFNAFAVAITAI